MTKKAAKVDAYMPLWIGDYLADTMSFQALEHGAYLLLLMSYWRTRAPLLDDDRELAGIARCSAAEWRAVRPKLARKFEVADGVWRHGRADQELASAIDRKEKAVKKAAAGGNARWKKGDKDAPSNASSSASSTEQAELEHCPSTSTSTSPSESSEAKASAAAGASAAVDKSTGNPPPPPPEDDRDAKRHAWRDCGRWLVANGVAEATAREFMGLLLKEHPATALDAMRQAPTQQPDTPDPRAYLRATAKRMAGDGSKTVPSDEAEKTRQRLDEEDRRWREAQTPEQRERIFEIRRRMGYEPKTREAA